jgi:hypothetical protein
MLFYFGMGIPNTHTKAIMKMMLRTGISTKADTRTRWCEQLPRGSLRHLARRMERRQNGKFQLNRSIEG